MKFPILVSQISFLDSLPLKKSFRRRNPARCGKNNRSVLFYQSSCIAQKQKQTQAPSTLRRRKLKTEVSLWKRIKCFLYTLRRRNLKTQQSTVILDLRLRKTTWLSWQHRFRKTPFSKCFPSTLKRKAGVIKFLQCEERFRKAPFSWRISVDGMPNRRNKAAFFKFLRCSADATKNYCVSTKHDAIGWSVCLENK